MLAACSCSRLSIPNIVNISKEDMIVGQNMLALFARGGKKDRKIKWGTSQQGSEAVGLQSWTVMMLFGTISK